ncbi:MAG TPA: four helix bundle protein [Thermoanaerobaculia bacterium]|jgi:four helix bundle protein
MRIERFEDIVAWQKARKLVTAIYKLTRTEPFRQDYALRNQLRSSAISIPANIAEGFERNRTREFHQFLSIAKASCAELRTYLYIVGDIEYATPEETERLMSAAREVTNYIGALRSSVAKNLRRPHSTQHSALSTRKRACS